jgi:dihydroorotase
MFDLLVKGGLVASASGLANRALAISDGTVRAVLSEGEPPPAHTVLNAAGMIILPGLVDAHVHFRDPGLTHKEDFASGSRAAAAGGVTTVMVMPTDVPFTGTPEDFSAKRSIGEAHSYVDFALQAGLAPSNVQHVAALAELGAVSFEHFLADLPAPLVNQSAADLAVCLEAVREVAGIAGVTPGDASLHRYFQDLADRRFGGDRRGHAFSRPPAAEALGVATALIVADMTEARLHLRQISCQASVAVLSACRSHQVTAEVTPHNLLLDEAVLIALGPAAKVAPPLRSRTDVEAMQKALADRVIDIVATDHAPHAPAEKAAGLDDIRKAPGGFAGVQTLLLTMLRMIDDGLLDYPRLVEVCAEGPARAFGLAPRKGSLGVGSDADFVVVHPNGPMVIRNEDQLSNAKSTPFDGLAVSATPISTYLRGRMIMQNGRVVEPPFGRFLAPT